MSTKATPGAIKLALDHNIALSNVRGSGTSGFITVHDVQRHISPWQSSRFGRLGDLTDEAIAGIDVDALVSARSEAQPGTTLTAARKRPSQPASQGREAKRAAADFGSTGAANAARIRKSSAWGKGHSGGTATSQIDAASARVDPVRGGSAAVVGSASAAMSGTADGRGYSGAARLGVSGHASGRPVDDGRAGGSETSARAGGDARWRVSTGVLDPPELDAQDWDPRIWGMQDADDPEGEKWDVSRTKAGGADAGPSEWDGVAAAGEGGQGRQGGQGGQRIQLILDLDNTLVHAAEDPDEGVEGMEAEEPMDGGAADEGRIHRFALDSGGVRTHYVLRMRDGVLDFLKQAPTPPLPTFSPPCHPTPPCPHPIPPCPHPTHRCPNPPHYSPTHSCLHRIPSQASDPIAGKPDRQPAPLHYGIVQLHR